VEPTNDAPTPKITAAVDRELQKIADNIGK
jgi:hypothetical protein